jgi:uncharacterized protein YecE (DUF72 family)
VPDRLLYAGTSGFAYASWKPDFYPQKLAGSQFLNYYGSRLNAVEVNYTYRRIAAATTFEKWIAATPDHFLFLPKAHMKITHSLKLKDAEDFTRYFLQSLEPLRSAGRLGPILFQLPPNFASDPARLTDFVRLLPRTVKAAFEFRNASWFGDDIYQILRDHNAALCMAENENLETPPVVTADFVYLRLRKPDYSEPELLTIDRRIQQYLSNCYPTFAIFKHEDTPAGAFNAEKLLETHSAASKLASAKEG